MTSKEYLQQIKYLNTMIQNLSDEIQTLRAEETSIRSAWPDGQPHGSGTTDPVGERAAKLADQLTAAESELLRRQSELYRKRREIIEAIGKVGSADCNRLLYLRYVQCQTWEQIAVDMGFTFQWVAGGLHGMALQEFEKIISS